MAQRLKEVDVVVIGVAMVGSIVAKELAAAGYKVVGKNASPNPTGTLGAPTYWAIDALKHNCLKNSGRLVSA